MSEEGEDRVVHIEKTDDEEEINARNEVNISINDSTNEYNRNANVTVKSKVLDVKELSETALEIYDKIKTTKQSNNKDSKGGHFG